MKNRLVAAMAINILALSWMTAVSPGYARLVAEEKGANTMSEPQQILRTGIDLCEPGLSPNTLQLADTIGLSQTLKDVLRLRETVDGNRGPASLESLAARQDLWDATLKAALIIQHADLEIDFALAELSTEQEIYSEMLATYLDDRDRALAKTNAASFISNGALWAVCEGLAVPTYKNAKYAIPSGITGILAGIIPSAASIYAMKQVSGKKRTSEVEPNMLAKIFGYPTSVDIEYPASVWTYLNQVPATDKGSKSRREQLIDNWISDANIKGFSDRASKKQLDVITASVSHRGGLSIETLTVRKVMLQRLSAEIMKMKRMLLELTMVLQGEKQFTVYEGKNPRHVGGKPGAEVR